MTDTTASDRTGAKGSGPLQSAPLRRRPYVMVLSGILLLAAGVVAGYTYGSHNSDTLLRKLETDQVRNQRENGELKSKYDAERSTSDALRAELKKIQDQLDEMFQSTRTVKLTADRAQRVSIGDFTIGLATGLGSSSVSVNINGTKKNMAPADKENLTFNCLVNLQSFDVLNSSAIFNTSCSPAPSQGTIPK